MSGPATTTGQGARARSGRDAGESSPAMGLSRIEPAVSPAFREVERRQTRRNGVANGS